MALALLVSTIIPPAKTQQSYYQRNHLLKPLIPIPGNQTRVYKFKIQALQETKEGKKTSSSTEDITEKYGLEFGLWKVGIATDEAGGKVGTFALAYAAHKAASPIRFPPTVALTPIVAGWIGKKAEEKKDN